MQEVSTLQCLNLYIRFSVIKYPYGCNNTYDFLNVTKYALSCDALCDIICKHACQQVVDYNPPLCGEYIERSKWIIDCIYQLH